MIFVALDTFLNISLQLLKVDIYKKRNDDQTAPPCHLKIRSIIIIALREAIRVLKIRSKNITELENLCTIMEERMVKNVYHIFDNSKRRRWILD